jgi:hypothetical protein
MAAGKRSEEATKGTGKYAPEATGMRWHAMREYDWGQYVEATTVECSLGALDELDDTNWAAAMDTVTDVDEAVAQIIREVQEQLGPYKETLSKIVVHYEEGLGDAQDRIDELEAENKDLSRGLIGAEAAKAKADRAVAAAKAFKAKRESAGQWATGSSTAEPTLKAAQIGKAARLLERQVLHASHGSEANGILVLRVLARWGVCAICTYFHLKNGKFMYEKPVIFA